MFIRKLFSLLLKLLFIKVNIYFKNHFISLFNYISFLSLGNNLYLNFPYE